MENTNTYKLSFLILIIILILGVFMNVSLGSVSIPFKEIFKSTFGTNIDNQSWQYIIQNYRLPKAFTAIITAQTTPLEKGNTANKPCPAACPKYSITI